MEFNHVTSQGGLSYQDDVYKTRKTFLAVSVLELFAFGKETYWASNSGTIQNFR